MTELIEETHSHRFPRAVLALLIVCLLGLAASVALSFIYAQEVESRLSQLEEFVAGRGDYRDAEAHRLDERIDRVVCDILGEFPAGDERADRLRTRYGCPVPDRPEEP